MTAVGFSRQNQLNRVEHFVSDAMSCPIYLISGRRRLHRIGTCPSAGSGARRAVVDVDRLICTGKLDLLAE